MGRLVEALGSSVAKQAEAKVAAKGKTGEERTCRADAKEIIGKVRLGSSIVLEKKEVPGVTKASFEVALSLVTTYLPQRIDSSQANFSIRVIYQFFD